MDAPFPENEVRLDGSSPEDGYWFKFKQRLSPALAMRLRQELENDTGLIHCALDGLRLIGSTDDDSQPLVDCRLWIGRAYIRGPIRTEGENTLFPVDKVFIHQDYWSTQGVRRHPVQKSQPPDEQLVLLCNSYAIPAVEALLPVLKAVFDQCFANGGWQGLSARYFRDYAFQPHYGEALGNLRDCIAKGNPDELEGALVQYCGIYLFAGAFVWHSSRIGTLANIEAISRWVKRHDALIEQVRILSGGINRKGLATFLTLNEEYIPMPGEVLKVASA